MSLNSISGMFLYVITSGVVLAGLCIDSITKFSSYPGNFGTGDNELSSFSPDRNMLQFHR